MENDNFDEDEDETRFSMNLLGMEGYQGTRHNPHTRPRNMTTAQDIQ